jgi:integrase
MPRHRKKGIKGAGSVFPRKDGRWVAQFIVEETGKSKQLYAKSEKEAWQKLQTALDEQKRGILATGPQQKLGDYITWWLEEVHKHKLRKGTYLLYRSIIKNHILPALEDVQLRKLTSKQIQTFYNAKLKENLSASYVHSIHDVLHGALKDAVKGRYISYNPADNIALPAPDPEREVKALTLEQAQHLLRVAQDHKLEGFIALALTTTMRHGELAALRWEDIHFDAGTISISRTLSRRQGGYYENSPKTKAGERIVPLAPALYDILKVHRARQADDRAKAGPAWKGLNLVFCNRYGGFLHDAHTREAFYKLLDKAGLPRMHIHDLRHSSSTLLRFLGVDMKVVQGMLGHSHIDITANVYSHVLPAMQKDAAERINILFQRPI